MGNARNRKLEAGHRVRVAFQMMWWGVVELYGALRLAIRRPSDD